MITEVVTHLDAKGGLQTFTDIKQRAIIPNSFIGRGTRHLEESMLDYAEGLYQLDPSLQWIACNPEGRFFDTSEVFSPDQIAQHEFFRWNRDECIGSVHWLLGYTPPVDGLTFGLSIHSSAEEGPLSEEKKALFKILFDHLDRALRLHARPTAFTDVPDCLILLDRAGELREASPAALELLREADGLTVYAGRLVASNSLATRRLLAAVASALNAITEGGSGGAVSLPRPSGRRNLLLTVAPLPKPPPPFEAFGPAAVVRVVDPEKETSPSAEQTWAELFDLTPAEARLCRTLMECEQNLHRAADELGITYATARVHLRKVFEKTDTHSQAQLARLLTRVE